MDRLYGPQVFDLPPRLLSELAEQVSAIYLQSRLPSGFAEAGTHFQKPLPCHLYFARIDLIQASDISESSSYYESECCFIRPAIMAIMLKQIAPYSDDVESLACRSKNLSPSFNRYIHGGESAVFALPDCAFRQNHGDSIPVITSQ